MNCIACIRCVGCFAVGIALSTAHPIGIILSVGAPALILIQTTRQWAYTSALFYYCGALWPIIPGAQNFFGPRASVLETVALWIVSSLLLALPWFLVWTKERRQLLWRAPAGLMLSVLPPLGLIGWASPLTSAGLLFPGTCWCGLFGCALATGALAWRPKSAIVVLGTIAIGINLFFVYAGDTPSLTDWQGVNTNFGAESREQSCSLAEFQAAESIQGQAVKSNARVIVFPEAVVSSWTAATDSFWEDTINRLVTTGKTIIVGAKVIEAQPESAFSADDLAMSIATLRSSAPVGPLMNSAPQTDRWTAYRNVLIVRGHENTIFDQRIPVPVSMWRPFARSGVPLHLAGPAVLPVAGQRAAVLICYEQLLTWPILTSLLGKPTVIVAAANDYWARGTTIPAFQLAAVRAWARLMALPYVSATNI
jgi:predicted amidohydrolase